MAGGITRCISNDFEIRRTRLRTEIVLSGLDAYIETSSGLRILRK
jgi:hypothetical protein